MAIGRDSTSRPSTAATKYAQWQAAIKLARPLLPTKRTAKTIVELLQVSGTARRRPTTGYGVEHLAGRSYNYGPGVQPQGNLG